mgnify:CR=1 FL=1
MVCGHVELAGDSTLTGPEGAVLAGNYRDMPFSRQASFPLQESWSGLSFPTPEDLPTQGSNLSLASPALAGGFFTTEPPGKLLCYIYVTDVL